MIKANLHTHTAWCDGKNTAEEMVLSAIEAGFDVLGFSGHSYTSFDESYCMSREDTHVYRQEIRRLADVYRDRIAVFCGIEQDLFADDPITIGDIPHGEAAVTDKARDIDEMATSIDEAAAIDEIATAAISEAAVYDYAIGSVHALFKECSRRELEAICAEGYPSGVLLTGNAMMPCTDPEVQDEASADRCGVYFYVDWEAETLRWAIRRLYGGDSPALAEDYFHAVSRFAAEPACRIVGHFDLLTKFEEQAAQTGGHLFDTRDPRYLEAAGNAIFALSAAGKIFEINTGAMAKGYRTRPYPDARLLELILQAGGRITVNSDCHAAGKLDYGFSDAFDLARGVGFTEFWTLGPDGSWMAQKL